MTNKRIRIKRIMMAISVVMLMLLLCGCRTRITNSPEVTSVVNDENGFLQESYELRRAELSLSEAEDPLFTGLSNRNEEEDVDYDDDPFDDYDEDDEDDEDDDDGEDDSDSSDDSNDSDSNSNNNSNSSSGQSNTTPRRTTPTTTPQVSIRVTLNPNGGTCSRSLLLVKKGGTYGTLPTPTRSGYTFKGWYTALKDGKRLLRRRRSPRA